MFFKIRSSDFQIFKILFWNAQIRGVLSFGTLQGRYVSLFWSGVCYNSQQKSPKLKLFNFCVSLNYEFRFPGCFSLGFNSLISGVFCVTLTQRGWLPLRQNSTQWQLGWILTLSTVALPSHIGSSSSHFISILEYRCILSVTYPVVIVVSVLLI